MTVGRHPNTCSHDQRAADTAQPQALPVGRGAGSP
jgi:hypothetical protein